MTTRDVLDFDTPIDAYNYAHDNNCRLNLKGEQLIAEDVHCSYIYAFVILKDRFELGEKAIAQSFYYCDLYIKGVFKCLVPLDFLELCSIEYLECLKELIEIKNKDDLIKVLFKKKLLGF